jgi:hypothetical protein
MASNSVNVPTNPKIKEQDVNAKLQLYGIYSGMSPSNAAFAPRNRRIMKELSADTHSSICQWQSPFGQYSHDTLLPNRRSRNTNTRRRTSRLMWR